MISFMETYRIKYAYVEQYRWNYGLFLFAFNLICIFTVDEDSKIRIDYISRIMPLAERLEILI